MSSPLTGKTMDKAKGEVAKEKQKQEEAEEQKRNEEKQKAYE